MKVLLIGAKGIVGTVLQKGIKGHELSAVDLPELDVLNYEALVEKMKGQEAVIHLAWTVHPSKPPHSLALDNISMVSNVFEAAKETGVKRVLVASSVHADNFYDWDVANNGYLPVEKPPVPTSPYGASKVFMESLGSFYAAKEGLEVICLRLGAVRPGDKKPKDYYEQAVWLRHCDLCRLVQKSLEIDSLPGNFAMLNVVSDNRNRIHDYSNVFGWKPKETWRMPKVRVDRLLSRAQPTSRPAANV